MELRSLGRYRLVEPLPVTSTVTRLFLAAHEDQEGPPRFVAKVLMPGDGEEFELLAAQFAHEAKLLHAFNHPGIPTLVAKGTQHGVEFVVMDYVDGVSLAQLLGHDIGEPRALSKEVAVYLMGQLADAVRHVHTYVHFDPATGAEQALDVLHRDLCPANVFLSVEGDVVLGDFGSASSIWLDAAHTSKQAGHTAYKAPERVTGSGEATIKSELFSMAVILWEILKGQRCFKAEDDIKTMDAIARFDISHSSRRVSGLSPKLSEIVRKNLDRDPERRYKHAYQVLQRLSQSPEAQVAEQSRLELGALVRACRKEREA